MNKSKRIMGELDYGADFDMKLIYGDGYTEDYDLALGEEWGNPGMLVSFENTGRGYTIPAKNADKLREFVYGVPVSSSTDEREPAEASVKVSGPVTISRNELYPLTNKVVFLNLQLLEGQYSEEWATPGPLGGRSWRGHFQLVVTDELGKTLNAFSLSGHFTDELSFNDFFQIRFDDYNGDGSLDFTIGQYGSSNGNFYRLFTIRKDYDIEELSIKPGPELFISSPDRYSVNLEKANEHGFRIRYYDNAVGKQAEDVYRWDGAVFQKVNK
ncbi:hypothetical protein PaeBR_16725 [Paenibacillus sp. BR2-3]|uniref:hypothetical protein n=1 Tax=Paenibacillus sp. BR2-3 TaxID=3048494 RepID=UPI003977B90C